MHAMMMSSKRHVLDGKLCAVSLAHGRGVKVQSMRES
jgi:hypothetical protein